ncbi:L-aspartate oxidase [Cerasicoccus arenae]|uniref:L-aspartate oxidase n=1 Tax=Cerasicoccus arenae TaxID=424488 RepID=A0A8J3D9T5_9BACT|nr:L-aspartate oxidase [Cerasicoccus arenae]MBK1859019.1 L-aspartate oxidase [Cerasicoccus arenae]GHB94751.1 L-aspartate oxidase [Cerasicoccus arenae]
MKTFDVIVVGSGIAGLSFALGMGRAGHRVAIITKKNRAESNTNYAQGGIASVTSQTDDFELHVKDTLTAGDGLCDEAVVRAIISDGPARIQELIELGVDFTHLGDGRVSLHREGGHSKRRILHVKDLTGAAIEHALLDAVAACPKIEVLEHHMAIDLITFEKLRRKGMSVGPSRNRVVGLYALDSRQGVVDAFAARVVMLATGGGGQVYQYSTNPTIATGDGIAMAYRAGAEIRNMEFIQFHPTALFTYTHDRFLISEAVRGEGAILRNLKKEAFMARYDDRRDLAPRDVVARAIDSEMKKSGAQHLWLDITNQSEESLRDRFPTIFDALLKHGINMATDPIPVVPACHYLCGGVTTDLTARTSLPGLLACGEVACTGLHGANRLASNSLLEACVLARDGVASAEQILKETPLAARKLPDWVDGDMRDPDERVVLAHNLEELKRTMWDYVGIVRTTKRLRRAKTRISNLQQEIMEYYWNYKVEPDFLELRNLIQLAELIVDCALQRKESRGLHYTLDYPDLLPEAIDSVVQIHASMKRSVFPQH